MVIYCHDDVQMVVGWLRDPNPGKTLRSSTYVNVSTPLSNDREDPVLMSSEMPEKTESLLSCLVISNPSVEPGTRFIFLKRGGKKEGDCAQVLTVINLSVVYGSARLTRLEILASNRHFGGVGFPYPDSTDADQYLKRNDLFNGEEFQKVGVDHAILCLYEGDHFWEKRGESLFACIVRNSTDPINPLCLFSSVSPGDCFGEAVSEKIDLNLRVLGNTIFKVYL